MPTVTGPVTIVRTVKRDATTAAASGGTSELMRVTAVAHGGWLCVEPLMDEVANQGLDSELVSEAQDATYTAFLARGPWRGAKTKTKVKTTAYTAFTVDQYCRVEGRVWVKVTTVPQRKKADLVGCFLSVSQLPSKRLPSLPPMAARVPVGVAEVVAKGPVKGATKGVTKGVGKGPAKGVTKGATKGVGKPRRVPRATKAKRTVTKVVTSRTRVDPNFLSVAGTSQRGRVRKQCDPVSRDPVDAMMDTMFG